MLRSHCLPRIAHWFVSKRASRLLLTRGIITDILHFFPLCAHIHLWSLEALMSLLRYEETNKANSLARPVFESVTNLMSIHLKDG